MRVFAHHHLCVDAHFFTRGRQAVKGLHGHEHFVTDAIHINHDEWRLFVDDAACELANHGFPLCWGFTGRMLEKRPVIIGCKV